MSFSYWTIVLYSAFFPFIACVLILLTPGKLKKYTIKVIDLLFFWRIGTYPFINVVMFIEGITWMALFRTTYTKYQDYLAVKEAKHHPHGHMPEDPLNMAPAAEFQHLAKMWREQRNCYVAAWGFTSWWMLYIVMSQQRRIETLREESERLLKQPGAPSVNDEPKKAK